MKKKKKKRQNLKKKKGKETENEKHPILFGFPWGSVPTKKKMDKEGEHPEEAKNPQKPPYKKQELTPANLQEFLLCRWHTRTIDSPYSPGSLLWKKVFQACQNSEWELIQLMIEKVPTVYRREGIEYLVSLVAHLGKENVLSELLDFLGEKEAWYDTKKIFSIAFKRGKIFFWSFVFRTEDSLL